MGKDKIIFDKTYKGYSINNGINNDFGCYTKTLEQVIDQVENMAINHSKVSITRLDIRSPESDDKHIKRKDMTRIIENFKRSLNRKYADAVNKPDLHTVWTSEKTAADKKEHYHLLASVNGNAIQNGYAVYAAVNNAVKKYLKIENDGLVEFCKSNGKYGKMIDRNDPKFAEQIQDAVYAGSYLAKTNSKEHRNKGDRISSASRLPKNWKDNPKYHELFANKAVGINSGSDCGSASENHFECQNSNTSFSVAGPVDFNIDNDD